MNIQSLYPPLRTFLALLLLAALLPGTANAAKSKVIDYSLQDLQGQTHTPAEYRGKWVVINYWATWCPPCVEEIPELVLFHEQNKDDKAVVLGVAYDDVGRQKIEDFAEEYFVTYPIVHVRPKRPAKPTPFGYIRALPTTYVLDPNGKVVAKAEGGITQEGLEEFINNYRPKP